VPQPPDDPAGTRALVWFERDLRVRDHAPLGHCIRQWVPEFGAPAYPAPIVDERVAVTAAKDRLCALRQTPECQGRLF
jgi:deoxyribodipyrimidine photo-lyase